MGKQNKLSYKEKTLRVLGYTFEPIIQPEIISIPGHHLYIYMKTRQNGSNTSKPVGITYIETYSPNSDGIELSWELTEEGKIIIESWRLTRGEIEPVEVFFLINNGNKSNSKLRRFVASDDDTLRERVIQALKETKSVNRYHSVVSAYRTLTHYLI